MSVRECVELLRWILYGIHAPLPFTGDSYLNPYRYGARQRWMVELSYDRRVVYITDRSIRTGPGSVIRIWIDAIRSGADAGEMIETERLTHFLQDTLDTLVAPENIDSRITSTLNTRLRVSRGQGRLDDRFLAVAAEEPNLTTAFDRRILQQGFTQDLIVARITRYQLAVPGFGPASFVRRQINVIMRVVADLVFGGPYRGGDWICQIRPLPALGDLRRSMVTPAYNGLGWQVVDESSPPWTYFSGVRMSWLQILATMPAIGCTRSAMPTVAIETAAKLQKSPTPTNTIHVRSRFPKSRI